MSSKDWCAGRETFRQTAPVRVSSQLYRRACAQFATGIAVVTVADANGEPHGLTVNSFTSVSLDPPLVLVSIDLRNSILGHFDVASFFAINVLAEGQAALSQHFSTVSRNRFEGVPWTMSPTRVPLIEGVLAHLECAVVRKLEVGDHTVLIGEVSHAAYAEGRPLIYFNSGYRCLPDPE
jgi:flavin reductase (DIM6/NTAB) family NADH-FMN oxidoreductase RutF